VKMPSEWLDSVIGSAKISKLGLPVIVPVAEFRDIVGAAVTATLSGADPANRTEKGARAIPADPGAQRKVVSGVTATEATPARFGHRRARPAPMAAAILLAVCRAGAGRGSRVIIFPGPIRSG